MSQSRDQHHSRAAPSLFDGRYRLGAGRWEGAVGVVRQAQDTHSADLLVAIKHPDPYLGPEPRAYKEQLLDTEAHALRTLAHLPQVCPIVGEGRVGSGAGAFRYLAIAWAKGEPVADMVRRAGDEGRVLPIGTALLILHQLAHVLAEAHRHGLINNDVDVKHLFWDAEAHSLQVIDWGNSKNNGGADWAAFGYRADLEQFADAMYCLLTGSAELDVRAADHGYWQRELSGVLPAVRADLVAIGVCCCQSGANGYSQADALHDDLSHALVRLEAYLEERLRPVDIAIANSSPPRLAEADAVLAELDLIAPGHASIARRAEAIGAIRRRARELAALQMATAYVKAESWLDAVEVLSRTFGHDAPPQSDAAVLLSAVKRVHAPPAEPSHPHTITAETMAHWTAAAKALAHHGYDEALDHYLAARGDGWRDLRVEPVPALLGLTNRYVLRDEADALAAALGDGEVASRVRSLGEDLRRALEALRTLSPHDWAGEGQAYRGICEALSACGRQPSLGAELARRCTEASERACGLVALREDAIRALAGCDAARAADSVSDVRRIDPDSASAAVHAEHLRLLQPVLERADRLDAWQPGIDPAVLDEPLIAEVEAAFATLPDSTLRPQVADVVRELVARRAAEWEAEYLRPGLALLNARSWSKAVAWSVDALQAHPEWEAAGLVGHLAGVYAALYSGGAEATGALRAATRLLAEREGLEAPNEALAAHARRLDVLVAYLQHLLSADVDRQPMAAVALDSLPPGDPWESDLREAMTDFIALREALSRGTWSAAAEHAVALATRSVPVLPGLGDQWVALLGHLASAERAIDAGDLESARVWYEAALEVRPPVALGAPAPAPDEVLGWVSERRDAALLPADQAAVPLTHSAPAVDSYERSGRASAGDRARASGAVGASLPVLLAAARRRVPMWLSGMLRWALGGAAILIVAAVVVVAFVVSAARGAPPPDTVETPTAEAAFATLADALREGRLDDAQRLASEWRLALGSELTEAQSAQLQSVAGCLWLDHAADQVASQSLRDDLLRLERVVQDLDQPDSLCATWPIARDRLGAALQARWDHVYRLAAAGDVEATLDAVAQLQGLESLRVAEQPVPGALRAALVEAHAALAATYASAGDCAAAEGHVVALERLVAAAPELHGAALQQVSQWRDRCGHAEEACRVLAALAADATPQHPGRDLAELAELYALGDQIAASCPQVSLAALVDDRLARLDALLHEGAFDGVREEVLALRDTPWLTQPPGTQGIFPLALLVEARLGQVGERCSEHVACGLDSVVALDEALALYQEHAASWPAEVVQRLDGARHATQSACAACRLDAVTGQAVSERSLLDAASGKWAYNGVYPSDVLGGTAWHLNDLFIRQRNDPLDVIIGPEGEVHRAYRTALQGSGSAGTILRSLRVQARLLNLRRASDGLTLLWGLRVPGSYPLPRYLLVAWEPADGSWWLVDWSPAGEPAHIVALDEGPADLVNTLQVVRSADGRVYDVYWQGVLALPGRLLPAEVEEGPVELMVGQDVHAWLRELMAITIEDE